MFGFPLNVSIALWGSWCIFLEFDPRYSLLEFVANSTTSFGNN